MTKIHHKGVSYDMSLHEFYLNQKVEDFIDKLNKDPELMEHFTKMFIRNLVDKPDKFETLNQHLRILKLHKIKNSKK